VDPLMELRIGSGPKFGECAYFLAGRCDLCGRAPACHEAMNEPNHRVGRSI